MAWISQAGSRQQRSLLDARFLLLIALASCGESNIEVIDFPPAPKAPTLRWELVKVYPHDREAFTQGLLFHDGQLFESTGLYGRSTLRQVELETGRPIRTLDLPPYLFGEGLAEWNGILYQLTWRENQVLRWDLKTFDRLQPLRSPWEGWGLTTWGERLLHTDGSEHVRVIHPDKFREVLRIVVRTEEGPLTRLNELEMIEGKLYANILGRDQVAQVDLSTGHVTGWLDFTDLLPTTERSSGTNVLNGIAWREETRTLFVTGKNWPLLFEVRLLDF